MSLFDRPTTFVRTVAMVEIDHEAPQAILIRGDQATLVSVRRAMICRLNIGSPMPGCGLRDCLGARFRLILAKRGVRCRVPSEALQAIDPCEKPGQEFDDIQRMGYALGVVSSVSDNLEGRPDLGLLGGFSIEARRGNFEIEFPAGLRK